MKLIPKSMADEIFEKAKQCKLFTRYIDGCLCSVDEAKAALMQFDSARSVRDGDTYRVIVGNYYCYDLK